MNVASIFVVFAVLWFLVFLMAIPVRLKTQGDLGNVVAGTSAGAPEIHHLRVKAKITTVLTVILTALAYYIVSRGFITIENMDVFNRLGTSGGDTGA